MTEIGDIKVDLKVLVGQATLSMAQFLEMGRGSVITLDGEDAQNFAEKGGDHPLVVTANNRNIAEARVHLQKDRIGARLTKVPEAMVDAEPSEKGIAPKKV